MFLSIHIYHIILNYIQLTKITYDLFNYFLLKNNIFHHIIKNNTKCYVILFNYLFYQFHLY
jgi:hypothetical protein